MKNLIKYLGMFLCVCILMLSLSSRVFATENATQENAIESDNTENTGDSNTENTEDKENEQPESEEEQTIEPADETTNSTEEDEKEDVEVEGGSEDSYLLILDGYNVSSERLISGEDSLITLSIRNTNTKLDAKNVVVTISSRENTILPRDGLSNQFFVDTIAAKSTKSVEIPLSVTQGFVGYNDLEIKIDYAYTIVKEEKKIETSFSNEMVICLPVSLASVLTENLLLSNSGDTLDVIYKNIGSRDVYNVTAHVSGDLSGTENYFLGNIAGGEEGTAHIPVTFLSGGNKNIKIYYSYTNDRGESIQSDVSSFLVSAIKTIESLTDDIDSEVEGNTVSTSFIIIMIICLGAIIVSIVFGRNSKKV